MCCMQGCASFGFFSFQTIVFRFTAFLVIVLLFEIFQNDNFPKRVLHKTCPFPVLWSILTEQKTSYFFSASFLTFILFFYFLGGGKKAICQIVIMMSTPAKCRLNIYGLNICQDQSLKQTPSDSAVCVLYEPHFLLESKFREMSWLSV